MADARDKHVWDVHAKEHRDNYKEAYSFDGGGTLSSLFKRLYAAYNINTVVDLGCGSALWRNLFTGVKYIGVDQNENMISCAADRFPDDIFIVSNGMNLPFEDSSIDLVFTSAVLQHNCKEDKDKVVSEIARVLRGGGVLLCTETTFRPDNYAAVFPGKEYSDDLTDGYSYTQKGWERYFESFGFSLIEYIEPSEYAYELSK